MKQMIEMLAISILFATCASNLSRAELMRYRLETVDLLGTPIDSVNVGDAFGLRTYVQDTRTNATGVVSAYLDLSFESDRVSLQAETFVFGPQFGDLPHVDFSSGEMLDEVGSFARGFASIPPIPDSADGGERLFWEVQFVASALGVARFTTDPADLFPRHATTLRGIDDAIAADDILFGSTSITIVPEPARHGWAMLVVLGFAWVVRRQGSNLRLRCYHSWREKR